MHHPGPPGWEEGTRRERTQREGRGQGVTRRARGPGCTDQVRSQATHSKTEAGR